MCWRENSPFCRLTAPVEYKDNNIDTNEQEIREERTREEEEWWQEIKRDEREKNRLEEKKKRGGGGNVDTNIQGWNGAGGSYCIL